MSWTRVLAPAFAALLMGCSVVSPPPLMPELAGTAPNTPGDMRILFVVGIGAGLWVDSAFGGELRVESQVNEWATVGGGLGGGLNLEDRGDESKPDRHNHPRWLYGARTWGRFNPGELDWLAITAGAGLSGTDRGLVALTIDSSTLFGHPFNLEGAPGAEPWRLTPYGGPAAALSIPLRQGEPIMKQKVTLGLGPDIRTSSTFEPAPYQPTFFLGAQGGLAVDSPGAPAWTGAIELLSLVAVSSADSAVLFAITTGQGVRVRP